MKQLISGFDWDSCNRRKCTKHGLSVETIEQILRGDIRVISDATHSQKEKRYIAVGLGANGKPAFVAFTYRIKEHRLLIRPISARYMHKKEARKYEKTTP
jgi:uncharacterized protein